MQDSLKWQIEQNLHLISEATHILSYQGDHVTLLSIREFIDALVNNTKYLHQLQDLKSKEVE
jgi:hypothetical protein